MQLARLRSSGCPVDAFHPLFQLWTTLVQHKGQGVTPPQRKGELWNGCMKLWGHIGEGISCYSKISCSGHKMGFRYLTIFWILNMLIFSEILKYLNIFLSTIAYILPNILSREPLPQPNYYYGARKQGNTNPWLADNQSRDINNEFWLDVYLIRSFPDSQLQYGTWK